MSRLFRQKIKRDTKIKSFAGDGKKYVSKIIKVQKYVRKEKNMVPAYPEKRNETVCGKAWNVRPFRFCLLYTSRCV